MMDISCCIWALTPSSPIGAALDRVAALGFTLIDLQPHTASRDQVDGAGLAVSCVALSHGAPEDVSLDNTDAASVSRALTYVYSALDYAAEIGATRAYVVPNPGSDRDALPRYARALELVADRAGEAGLRLCVEHYPGTPLATVAATLGFLREIDHPNLQLLFDIGHAQMSKEEPTAAIVAAGPLLGYLHLDDNDGEADLHLGLTDGEMTVESLGRALSAVVASPYAGPASLELHPELADPAAALRRGRALVVQTLSEIDG